MTDRPNSTQDFQDFELLLEQSLPELPPQDIVAAVTPWRRAMNWILSGLALGAVTLNFWNLNYILPAVGAVLILLGFRALRRENRWFAACYGLSWLRLGLQWAALMQNATIFRPLSALSSLWAALPILLQMVFLWRGLLAVQRKAGLPQEAKGAAGMVLWYAAVWFLAVTGLFMALFGFALLAALVLLLRSLFRLSGALDEAGYAVTPAPLRLSDRALALLLSAVLAAGIAAGYRCGSQYPMAWQPAAPVSTQNETKAHLLSLGFPEDILEDLTEEDLAECAGAVRVYTEIGDYCSVTDEKEKGLLLTGVAVELPEETFKLIHHFRFVEPLPQCGTAALALDTSMTDTAWKERPDHFSGQLLYTLDGQRYAAPYASIGPGTYSDPMLPIFGVQERTFALFSFPNEGGEHRGYLSCTARKFPDAIYVASYFEYVYQTTWRQYPVITAQEYFSNHRNKAFQKVYGDLAFVPDP